MQYNLHLWYTRSPLIITEQLKTSLTYLRQALASLARSLLHRQTRHTRPECHVLIARCDQCTIVDHSHRLVRRILRHEGALAGIIAIIPHVREEHNRQLCCIVVVTTKERRSAAQFLRHEDVRSRDDGHAMAQTLELGLRVGVIDLGAVGVVGGGVGGVVIDEEEVHFGAVEEGPDGVVLVGETAVGEGEALEGGDEGGGAVVEEGIGVFGVAGGSVRESYDCVGLDGRMWYLRDASVFLGAVLIGWQQCL